MDDYSYDQILGDFEDSMYDGGGERNRGGCSGGRYYRPTTYSEISMPFIRETEKAVCIEYHDSLGVRNEWFPKSQLIDLKIDRNLIVATFNAPTWLLEKKRVAFKQVVKECEEIGLKAETTPDPSTGGLSEGWFKCPDCDGDEFGIINGTYKFMCSNCGKTMEWEVKNEQKPVKNNF